MNAVTILFFVLFLWTNIEAQHLAEDSLMPDSMIQRVKRSDELEPAQDLETAAGTNVLRPLFVYRQQVASRERLRKAGARRPFVAPQA